MARQGPAWQGEAWRGRARLGAAGQGKSKGPYGQQHNGRIEHMSRLFIGGRDTNPEVDAIRATIKVEVGASVSHDDVARVAGLDVGSVRFRTVVNRWRRKVERDTAVRVESRDRVFRFLTPDEALDRSKTDLHRIGKATGKLHVRVGAIDVQALTGDRKEEHFLLVRETAALLDGARRSAKAIQGPKAVKPANLRLAK